MTSQPNAKNRTGGRRKTKPILLTLTPAERAQIEELASAEERSMASFARIVYRLGLEVWLQEQQAA